MADIKHSTMSSTNKTTDITTTTTTQPECSRTKPQSSISRLRSVVSGANGADPPSQYKSIETCTDPVNCVTLQDILKAFSAPISEDQAWAIIYQTVATYKQHYQQCDGSIRDLKLPSQPCNLCLHKDGGVHIRCTNEDPDKCAVTSQKKILLKLGIVVYTALDFNLPSDEECIISPELEQLINHMTLEDVDDEGIERDSEDVEDIKTLDTKELDCVLQMCAPRVTPSNPEDHYKAVCRALATESLELRVFLQKVIHGDAEALRIKANAETSRQELAKLGFTDWARFWMQVVDELRRGVRLKKSDFSRTPIEFEMTPYEILMGDIRARKFNLRKVMVNGDIPPRVKKDAHAVILEFIRSRPPLKKVSERKLQPLKRNPSPREQLLDSIRKGRVLKHVQLPRLKSRLLPATQTESVKREERQERQERQERESSQKRSSQGRQRLIQVDFSLFQDEDAWDAPSGTSSLTSNQSSLSGGGVGDACNHSGSSSGQYNNENNPNNINTSAVLRRRKDTITHDEYHRFCDNALESYDLATQCESRRASMRRHTIVGCHGKATAATECHSTPPSRPDSRQSEATNNTHSLTSMERSCTTNATETTTNVTSSWPTKSPADDGDNSGVGVAGDHQWSESINGSDRLSLTLEEIVHIRSVMTKAELEGLPVGVRVKEEVEKKKVCFLCLRTRFGIFGPWGVQCKLCQRTVCQKCFTKMRIPTEHFRNVPVVLLSPSLMNSPVASQTPSPIHHAHHTTGHATNSSSGMTGGSGPSSMVDESFPKSLMDRLMRPESDRKARHTVGSAPSSPKHQRSTSSTPGASLLGEMHPPSATNQMSLSMAPSTGNTLTYANGTGNTSTTPQRSCSVMSRSMEGPKSLPPQSPARPHSNNSTLDRRFARAFATTSSSHLDHKEAMRGEKMSVCNDCRGLVYEIIRSSKQTRSTARNKALKNLTLDLSPVYKRW